MGMSGASTIVAVDPTLQRRMDQVVKKITELTDERDQLVLQAREAGASLREIAAHAGMSHVGIKKLIGRLMDRIDSGRPVSHVAAEAGVSRQRLGEWHRRWIAGEDKIVIQRDSEEALKSHRKANKRPGYTYLHAAIDDNSRAAPRTH